MTLTDSDVSAEPELLTPEQAATLLGVSRGTVYRWVHEGAVPALRVHDGPKARIRIVRAELWQCLRSHAERHDARGAA